VLQGWPVRAPIISDFSQVWQPGHVLGGRYEILGLLGEGGMGAVYKARDREVDREVALKVIRPELTGHPDIVRRFKQELILARQVTHKNVVRIFDLGEAEGAKFISMEYIEGRDLRSLLAERGKFAPEEAVGIIEQVCRALDAAHAEGVIHRDLKPQNIMVDKHGRVAVMDFGIARSREVRGLTQTGALLGTPEYMSPEQAKGEEIDSRSDLFSLGIIFYELLAGKSPYAATTQAASLLRRIQERAIPPAKLDPAIPKFVNDVVVRCLEIDPQRRYASAQEIVHDLEARQRSHRGLATLHMPRFRMVEEFGTKWIAPALTLLLLLIIGLVFRGKIFERGTKPAEPATSLAILPFRNASGDPKLDWLGTSLAEMLSTDVGQSSHLRMVSSDRLHEILHTLRIEPNSTVDPDTLRRLAEFSNADTVVWGQYARFGDQIRVDATLQDLKRDRRVPLKVEVPSEKEVPGGVDRLAESIRQSLSVSRDTVKELKASSYQPTSKSVEALREYNRGVELLREGKNLEALSNLQAAVKDDPQFALAYSRLAEADSDLGYDSVAEQYSRKALELSLQLPVAEKFLIEVSHARVMKDNKKAIQAYENLAQSMPASTDVEFALATLYTDVGDHEKALAQLSKLLQSDPNNIKALWQTGVVENANGKPQAALEPLNKGLSLAIQTDEQELKALILQSMGISYRHMNKVDDAMQHYQEAMAINRRLGLKRNLAGNLVEMALILNAQGKPDAALADYNQALELQREIGMKKEVGDTLNNIGVLYQSQGKYDKALQNYKESLQIQRDAGDEDYQAMCLNNIGGIYLAKGDTDNALTYLQQALQLREKLNIPTRIAETLAVLGQVYNATGQYDEALKSFMGALDLYRKAGDLRSAAYESDDIGLVFQYQGRLGAAVSAMQEAVNGYHALGDRSSEMVDLLNDLADTLGMAGRGPESAPLLQEAQKLARDLKSQSLEAELLHTEGDVGLYRGDWKSARDFYDRALRAASHGTDPAEVLVLKLHLAEVVLGEGRGQSAIGDFRNLARQADSHALKYFSLESSVDMAEAMINAKDYSHAQQELQTDLGRSEKLGLRYQSARIHYLLGKALRLGRNGADAPGHYRQALSLIDEMRKEPGAEKLLERPDLKTVYAESTAWSQEKKE
jgi:tetratricopeptide (TPR) repeat protein/predicted Ser/Thr protein kinase/TolB-like protein